MPGALVQLTRRILALALISIAAAANDATDPGWELQDEDGTLQVFTRKVDDSPLLEVMATVQINASASRVTEFLGDGNGCAAWRAMCRSSQVLEALSDEERYVYLVLDMPSSLPHAHLLRSLPGMELYVVRTLGSIRSNEQTNRCNE